MANFGIQDQSLPAIFSSDVDASDAEMLISTLEKARKELGTLPEKKVEPTLKCTAKRQRNSGRAWVRCERKAVQGDQFCPIHLVEGRKRPDSIKSVTGLP